MLYISPIIASVLSVSVQVRTEVSFVHMHPNNNAYRTQRTALSIFYVAYRAGLILSKNRPPRSTSSVIFHRNCQVIGARSRQQHASLYSVTLSQIADSIKHTFGTEVRLKVAAPEVKDGAIVWVLGTAVVDVCALRIHTQHRMHGL